MQAVHRILGVLVAVVALAMGVAVVVTWQTGEANRPELKAALKIDKEAPFEPQALAVRAEMLKMDDAYSSREWFAPRTGLAYYADRIAAHEADFGDLEKAANEVASFPSNFAEIAETFAGACALALLGGVLMFLKRPRLGGLLLVAALGTSALLEFQRNPVFFMMPIGAIGLLALFTGPKSTKLPAEAEQQRLRALVSRLPQGGPLRFETSDAFTMNMAVGFIFVLPGLMYWSSGKTFPAEIDAGGVTTRGGQKHLWTNLAWASARTHRRRGWFIGRRTVRLEFTTGSVLLDEGALKGPFAAVWTAFLE